MSAHLGLQCLDLAISHGAVTNREVVAQPKEEDLLRCRDEVVQVLVSSLLAHRGRVSLTSGLQSNHHTEVVRDCLQCNSGSFWHLIPSQGLRIFASDSITLQSLFMRMNSVYTSTASFA